MTARLQRLGAALVAPRWLAVNLLDHRPGRGSGEVLLLIVLRVLLAESPRLVRAVFVGLGLGWDIGLQTALQVLQGALPLVIAILGGGIVVSFLLGRGRDPRDKPRLADYGADVVAYAAMPYFVLRLVEGLAWPLLLDGGEPRLRTRLLTAAPAIAWGLWLLVISVRTLRAVPPSAPTSSKRAALPLGVAIVALLGAGAIYPAYFAVKHFDELSRVTLKRGEDAPGWELPSLAGPTVSLESLRGRTVVLAFWATWCGVCKQELPVLNRLRKKLDPQSAVLFTVDTDGQSDSVRREVATYLAREQLDLPVLFDNGRASELYNVTSIPLLVVISPTGKVTKTFLGITSAATIEAAIAAAAR